MDLTVREIIERHKYTFLVAIIASILLWAQGQNCDDAVDFIKHKGYYQEYTEYDDL
jgi:hypothetical protein